MKSDKTDPSWEMFATPDYASSDYGVEEIATSYADAVASLRITAHEGDLANNPPHANHINVDSEVQEQVTTITTTAPNSRATCDSSRTLSCSEQQKTAIIQEAAVSEHQLDSSSAKQHDATELLTLLRKRLDTSADSLRFKQNEAVGKTTSMSSTTYAVASQEEQTPVQNVATSMHQAQAAKATSSESPNIDGEWSEFAQLQEFAHNVWSNQDEASLASAPEISPAEPVESVTESVTTLSNEVSAQATVQESQQARAHAPEVFAAARELLKRLHH